MGSALGFVRPVHPDLASIARRRDMQHMMLGQLWSCGTFRLLIKTSIRERSTSQLPPTKQRFYQRPSRQLGEVRHNARWTFWSATTRKANVLLSMLSKRPQSTCLQLARYLHSALHHRHQPPRWVSTWLSSCRSGADICLWRTGANV